MSEINPKPIPSTPITCYQELEGVMAEGLVRAKVALKRISEDLYDAFPLDTAKRLIRVSNTLQNLVPFAVENAEEIVRSPDWKIDLEDFVFVEKTKHRLYQNEGEDIDKLFEGLFDVDPEDLSHQLVNDFSMLVSRLSIFLTQLEDANEKNGTHHSRRKGTEILSQLNRAVLGLQSYLSEPEARPVNLWKMAPVFDMESDVDEIDQLNLIGFGFSIARSVFDGANLEDIARDLALGAQVDLGMVLQELYEQVPGFVNYFDSVMFSAQRRQTNPWPFTSAVRDWLSTRYRSTSNLSENHFVKDDLEVHFRYLYDLDIDFEEAHLRDDTGANPFEASYVADLDDFGCECLEVALIVPGLVPPNVPMAKLSKIQLDQLDRDPSIIRTIVLN